MNDNSNIQKKEIPNPVNMKIVPPNMDFIYLERNETFPFNPAAEDYDPVNQWWLADCAFLVYCHPQFARQVMLTTGLPEYRFFDGDVGETFAASDGEKTLVSFRGTEVRNINAFFDIAADLNFKQVEEDAGGMVHRGFKEALDEIWYGEDGLQAYLESLLRKNPDQKIWFTGHSMGGALATLAAARFPRSRGLYTFGAPKVGDEEFIRQIQIPTFRVVNNNDPIPLLPPNITLKNWSTGQFRHPGVLKLIDKQGLLRNNPKDIQELSQSFNQSLQEIADLGGKADKAVMSMAKRVFFGEGRKKKRTKIDLKNLNPIRFKEIISDYLPGDMTDHAPVYYAVHSWNNLVDFAGKTLPQEDNSLSG